MDFLAGVSARLLSCSCSFLKHKRAVVHVIQVRIVDGVDMFVHTAKSYLPRRIEIFIVTSGLVEFRENLGTRR